MATFDEIGNGSINVGEILKGMAINSLSTMARGLIIEMLSTNIHNFNLMNYDYMNIHMMRNAYEKVITLNSVGESAYTDGNGDAQATPAQYPSYTRGNNYMEFVNNTRQASNNGVLSTRVTNRDGNVRNLYIDDEYNRDAQVEFTGSYLDKNSILYKTKKLIRQNKLKTIVSQFHTEGVEYEGQIGSEYGESHGRNLLTKEAENGTNGYKVNGYDNPYCRVWTHHYQYDKLSKTMRANTSELNTWGGFEWEDTDKGHKKDDSHYGDGEKYDYAWRGKHNQERREAHSVLDTKTGLVKITPQYRNGGQKNRHTKDCMFSIENLAWKDYDPYSFEQALSWEQRGPFGGRIMWFPPYGIEITETASAKWNSNEFIGRGEPVYTYTNTERTGNLSFLMITDHPSSIDYASWWDDNTMIKGIDNGNGNSENDYLRYFAGCANDDNDGGNPKNNEPGKTGGLIIKPTPLTDEYLQEQKPPVIKIEKPGDKYPDPNKVNSPSKNPIYVEFFVFYPNNYSGVHDFPTKDERFVDSITYLLAGRNAEKNANSNDRTIHPYSDFSTTSGRNVGYEMGCGPITTEDCIVQKQYIQGGVYGIDKYVVDENKKWCYRIDHNQPYDAKNKKRDNFICEKLKIQANYKDASDYKTNLTVSENNRVIGMAEHKENLYSFAEVAAAFYSSNVLDFPNLYNYLIDRGVNSDRVNKLIDLFSNDKFHLKSIKCHGIASSHGHPENNRVLSNNRASTIVNWIHTNPKWVNVENLLTEADNSVKKVDQADISNVSGESAKLYRCAHCILEFETEGVSKNPENRDLPGFKWLKSVPQTDGSVWNYYTKDENVKYFEQEASGDDNYKESESGGDVTVTELQLLQIFDTYKPEEIVIIRQNSRYRGTFNKYGAYFQNFDYSKNDSPSIKEFSPNETFYPTDYVFYEDENEGTRGFYIPKVEYRGDWNYNAFDDVSNITFHYCEDDFVLYEGTFYKSLVDFDPDKTDNTFEPNYFTNPSYDEMYQFNYNWELTSLVDKVAAVLCWTREAVIQEVSGDASYTVDNNSTYSFIWKYGDNSEISVDTDTDLASYAQQHNVTFTNEETEYIRALVENDEILYNESEVKDLITLHRILDTVKKVNGDNDEVRDVCAEPAATDEEMYEKTARKDGTISENCKDNIWIDRGDGLLIQECNIGNDSVIARFNASTGEGDWNKLRYDQEYHFYKQWIADHPLMYEKLQEKIKYFNPAFHSMTPEGFNARCTFLQQCTRQGNTKTMSDLGGKTANNLAFGRPPYCVLRLGDFYYQMIVIDNITLDFSASDGLQWDLNTEGNGVQPMLCKVNISFKFIGGGDITGPVQRLQNAMSFNYYANTSFYDNRADRVEYKPTNWATMGGAGNNEVDLDKSYVYIAKLYEDQPDHIYKASDKK